MSGSVNRNMRMLIDAAGAVQRVDQRLGGVIGQDDQAVRHGGFYNVRAFPFPGAARDKRSPCGRCADGLVQRLGDPAARDADSRRVRRAARGARGQRAPHARRHVRLCRGRGRPRPAGHHRRRRRRRAPARHAGRQDHRAGARRAGGQPPPAGRRLAAFDRADAQGRAGGHLCHRRGRRGQRRAVRRGDAGQRRRGAARAAASPGARGRPKRRAR